MTQRLRALVGARDRLLHDVSHELRSPLTRLQLAIGLARQDVTQHDASIDRVEQEARKLERLVDELLTLARAESGTDPSREFLDPISAINAVIEDGRLEADEKDVAIELAGVHVEDEQRPIVAGSAALLQRAFENLLRNAIRFSPRGGRVLVVTELLVGPHRYRIAVEDEGPGVDPALLNSLLEPFVRLGPEGTGLGLAIADRAVRALGGSLECRNGAAGGFVAQISVGAVPL
jgi:two-component system OmpR family sensor kinase